MNESGWRSSFIGSILSRGPSQRPLLVTLVAVVLVTVCSLVYLLEHDGYGTAAGTYRREHAPTADVTPHVIVVNPKVVVNMADISSATMKKSAWNYNWDGLEALVAENSSVEFGTRTLIMIRHGQYNETTGILTDLGIEQAKSTAERLSKYNIAFRSLTYSPMIRARMTAEIILAGLDDGELPVEEDAEIREGSPIEPQPTSKTWFATYREYFVDGSRIEASFRKFVHRNENFEEEQTYDLLVAHGNVIRYFVLRALQLPPDAWLRLYIGHASISVLDLNSDGTVQLIMYSDTGHMPLDLITY